MAPGPTKTGIRQAKKVSEREMAWPEKAEIHDGEKRLEDRRAVRKRQMDQYWRRVNKWLKSLKIHF